MNQVEYLSSMRGTLLGYSFEPLPGGEGGGRDDQMGAKIKTPKNP